MRAGTLRPVRIGLLATSLIVLTFSSLPPSATVTANAFPIKHTIIIMEENHSFDNYFGTYPGANGLSAYLGLPKSRGSSNLVRPFHINGTTVSHDLCHTWECEHEAYDNGKMDGFVYATRSNLTMGYFDQREIPYYWDYASQFVLLDNFYSSLMGPTLPNHLYLMAGQSGGLVRKVPTANFTFKTIVDELDQNHISWKYYAGSSCCFNGWNPLPSFASFKSNHSRMKNLAETRQFYKDIADNTLADVVWVMPSSDQESEHPPYDISLGQRNVVSLINAVAASKYWDSAAIFLTWDEAGGWYDHVPPPQIDAYGYGFRVACLIVSPFAKQGYVDHIQGDFTSLLKFIETVYSLPPLTERDASANDLIGAFDFSLGPRPPFVLPGPYLPNVYPLTPRPNNTKIETTTSNSSESTVRYSTQVLPDLAVTALSINPQQPKFGDDVRVTYTVKNFGNGDASNFNVALYRNRTSGDYRRLDSSEGLSLKAGDSLTSSFLRTIKPTSGAITITVVVNDLAQIPESDSQDNAMSRTLLVPLPQSSENYTTTSTVTSQITTSVVSENIPTAATIFTGLIVVGIGLISFFLGMKGRKFS